MATQRSAAGTFVRFLLLALAVVIFLMAVGFVPTRRLSGDEGLVAMAVGCGISLVASVFGAIPLVLSQGQAEGGKEDPGQRLTAILMSMAVRFFVVLLMGVAAVLSDMFPKAPLLIWLGVSYLALLLADTAFALKTFSGPTS